MGISGLHAQLKSAQAPIEAEELRGKTLCVDGHALLHRGALSCCEDLAEGVTTTKYADYVVFRAKMLAHYGVACVVVFDGAAEMPVKGGENGRRRAARHASLAEARELRDASDGSEAATEAVRNAYGKTVRITPAMVELTRRRLLAEEIPDCRVLVAPYEADAQLCALCVLGLADGVVTEDSDLSVYLAGCRLDGAVLVTKMDRGGSGMACHPGDLRGLSSRVGARTTFGRRLANFADRGAAGARLFAQCCVLGGCDYAASLPGVGVVSAASAVDKLADCADDDRVAKAAAKLAKKGTAKADVQRYQGIAKVAEQAFFHARVWKGLAPDDGAPSSSKPPRCVPLADLLDPENVSVPAAGDLDGDLGPRLSFRACEAARAAAFADAYPGEVEAAPAGADPFAIAAQARAASPPPPPGGDGDPPAEAAAPAAASGIGGDDVCMETLAELPPEVRAQVERELRLWRNTRRGARPEPPAPRPEPRRDAPKPKAAAPKRRHKSAPAAAAPRQGTSKADVQAFFAPKPGASKRPRWKST